MSESRPADGEALAARLRKVHVGVRPELNVSRHVFRGKPTYVVQDPITFSSHQFSVADYQIFVRLNDEVSLEAVFDGCCDEGLLDQDQETDFYQFIVYLNQLGLLSLPVSDGKALFDRYKKREAARAKSWITGALFCRVPLIQPDALLGRTINLIRPFFSRACILLWGICVIICGAIIFSRRDEFFDPLATMLAVENLPLLWVLLVGLKLVHEFGHAYACKHFGGHVPEMGAFFILLTPCAYVDASDSWSFTNRWQRIFVSLAGVYFESYVAILAVAVWCLTEPSMLHSAAQFTIVISTVTTCTININPLMKYDGYHVLTDLVNLPNLRQQASTQLVVFIKRLLFGIQVSNVAETLRGRIGLGAFGLASACYKAVVLFSISMMIALRVPLVGILVAALFIGSATWQMANSYVWYILFSEELKLKRMRAVGVSLVFCVLTVGVAAVLPISRTSSADGLVFRTAEQQIRSPSTGFVRSIQSAPGELVSKGAPLFELANPIEETRLRQARAQLEFLRIQLHNQIREGDAEATTTQELVTQKRNECESIQETLTAMQIRSPIDGLLVSSDYHDGRGRFVRKGEPLAQVSSGDWLVNAVVDEGTFSRVQPRAGDRVWVRDTVFGEPFVGEIVAVGRKGNRVISFPELTQLAGGNIAVRPDNMTSAIPYFLVKIRIRNGGESLRHGMRVAVELRNSSLPIGVAVYRQLLSFLDRIAAS